MNQINPNLDNNSWKTMARQILGQDFFSDFMGGGDTDEPKYNIYRNASEIVVLINLPYVTDLSAINLNVREKEIYIKGKIDYGYDHLEAVHNQLFTGLFEKTIPLPDIVNSKKVNAQYHRGILKIHLFPKLRRDGNAVNIREY